MTDQARPLGEATSPALAEKKTSAGRVRCIDWLRGLAVFDMIMWHAACLLERAHDKTTLGILAGLVAPSFMFAAGFAIALVMIRASGDPAARRRRALKSLQRIGEVLVVAFVLKWLTRSASDPHWIVRIDILTCIALCLLGAWPVMFGLASRPLVAAAVCGALGVASFAAAPFIPDAAWGVLIAPNSSDFAPLPWGGYVLLGAAAGALGSAGLTGTALAGLFTLGLVFRFVPWGPWVIANAGERFMMFGGAALALYAIEREASARAWKLGWPPFSMLELVGTNALTAYVAHIWLLYINTPVVNFSYWGWWGEKAGWKEYWALLASLWAATMLVCWAWPPVSKAVSTRLPWNRAKAQAA